MRVLAVSYFFPPIGGAGVQRNVRLASRLAELGVEIDVVTGPAQTTSLWAPHDAGLAAQTSTRVGVHRLREPEPETTRLQARLDRLARLESGWSRWWRRGVVETGAALRDDYDLVWAQMQPYVSAAPAAELGATLGVPWIADLADPWALDEMLIYPSALHRRLALREMRRALASAAGIVMSTPEALRRLVDVFPELAAKPLTVGPVGWERADFETPPPPRSDDAFRIVHTGYLHTDLGHAQRRRARVRRLLGGSHRGVDILTRSHVYLLEAMDSLGRRRPETRGRIELHLAGVQTAADREASQGRPEVRMLDYVDHPEAVALMRSADLLFLPMHDLPPGDRATIVPGKTYEYLASRRPILAAVPEGDARDILLEAGNTSVCRPTDVGAMSELLDRSFDAFLAQERGPEPARAVIERYEYGRLAEDLAAFFQARLD